MRFSDVTLYFKSGPFFCCLEIIGLEYHKLKLNYHFTFKSILLLILCFLLE